MDVLRSVSFLVTSLCGVGVIAALALWFNPSGGDATLHRAAGGSAKVGSKAGAVVHMIACLEPTKTPVPAVARARCSLAHLTSLHACPGSAAAVLINFA